MPAIALLTLHPNKASEEQIVYHLSQKIHKIGRSQDCDIRIESDRFLSRFAATLILVRTAEAIYYRIVDGLPQRVVDGSHTPQTPSKSGLRINGKIVSAAMLAAGDVIQLSPVTRFRYNLYIKDSKASGEMTVE